MRPTVPFRQTVLFLHPRHLTRSRQPRNKLCSDSNNNNNGSNDNSSSSSDSIFSAPSIGAAFILLAFLARDAVAAFRFGHCTVISKKRFCLIGDVSTLIH